jgi:hypothetical protein
MQRSLELVNLKPFSINAAYANGGNGGRFKTQAFNEWQSEVFFQLSQAPNSVALKELREYFDSKKHKYEVQLIASYPKKEFYTKDGSISAKTHIPQPYGCKNLNIDDKFLTKCISEKVPSDSYSISIILYIKNL